MAKELSDIAWYLVETATAIRYGMEGIFRLNIENLKKRYPQGFEADKSINLQSDDE